MKISIYQKDIAYRTGGAESYTANLIQALQENYSGSEIILVSEKYSGKNPAAASELSARLNESYGTKISDKKFAVKFIKTKEAKKSCKAKILKVLSTLQTEFRLHLFQCSLDKITKQCDLFICSSMQLISGKAKKNAAIIYFPHDPYSAVPVFNKIKPLKKIAQKKDSAYKNYDLFIPISDFSIYYFKKIWNISDDLISLVYPPVIPVRQVLEKKDQILICSRIEKSKKIEELIKCFLKNSFLSENYKLVICGSTLKEDPQFIEYLKKEYPQIEFIFNPDRSEIERQYAQSKLFWHARGFGEEKPELFEHFGITTVEAMSAGCVPVVINKGGQPEIVTENCGFTWNTLEELAEKSEKVLKDKALFETLSKNAVTRSRIYYYESFKESIKAVLKKLQ